MAPAKPSVFAAAQNSREQACASAGLNATVVRSLHDLGLAAWFGGTLAGAVAINGAAADVPDREQRLRVANAGWARWTPVNPAAIAAHLVGGAGLRTATARSAAGRASPEAREAAGPGPLNRASRAGWSSTRDGRAEIAPTSDGARKG
jgi:hypothetical protein